MINSSITLYKKTFNESTRLEEWTKTHFDEVVWTGGKGASLNRGILESNDITIRVPATENIFRVGDIVIKGVGSEITTLTDLNDYYTINSVIDNSFYSSNPHVHLGAK